MRHFTIISSILLLVVCASSCNKYKGLEEDFVATTTEIGLSIKGESMFSYDPLKMQLGYNQDKHEYRVTTDDMSDFFIVKLDKNLSGVGSTCKGTVTFTTKDEIITHSGVELSLEKASGDGRMWLWSKKSGIGAVVRKL